MPRKAKEAIENEENTQNKEKKETKKGTSRIKKVADSSDTKVAKKSSTKKTSTTSKKDVTKKEKSEKSTVSSTKTTKRKSASTSKSTSKPIKKETKKSRATVSKRSTKKKEEVSEEVLSKPIEVPEYYDLPYHYDQTVVKVLAQTPKTLFVYWDVSEQDRARYEEQFGPDFFNNTIPFLKVKNETYGYSFEVDVDDFANGWYLHVEDARCNYSIELLRKQRPYTTKVIETPVYITSSNRMETPNDHILFDTNYNAVYFRDVKTNQTTYKNMSQISLLNKVGKIYNIYDFYKRIYKNENIDDIFDLNNPTSGNPTSTFK